MNKSKDQTAGEKDLSPVLKASHDLTLLLVTLLLNRSGINSSNGSKPPSGRFESHEEAKVAESREDSRGIGVKVNSVYMSQYRLIPCNCIEDHLLDQMQIPVSRGSIYNFNQEAL